VGTPTRHCRRCLSHAGRGLGWQVRLLGDDDRPLLSFPWYDHVDCALGGLRRYWFAPWRVLFADRPPTVLSDDGWDDVEQGWWGHVIPEGAEVYIAETDSDEIGDIAQPPQVTCDQPDNVFVNGVLITWNCVSRNTYDDAWQAAIKSCHQGRPHPVVREWER
jgi:hypothetical protein